LSSASTYNYERFDEHVMSGDSGREFAAFPKRLHAGETAPDGVATLLGGERVQLSDLWRRRGIVLEFGSFT
jgi:hypothetical protein